MGFCRAKLCGYFTDSAQCNSAPNPLVCKWETTGWNHIGHCVEVECYSYETEAECNSVTDKLDCKWQNNTCKQQSRGDSAYEICGNNDNKEKSCLKNPLCIWVPSDDFLRVTFSGLPTSLRFLWIVNNIFFIGFIVLILWYGQQVGSTKIVNTALFAFILDIISRYIGFWMDLRGYFAFSVLAILGGVMLILGAWQIPKWRRKLLEKTKQSEGFNR